MEKQAHQITITYRGTEYAILFDLNVMEEIQEEYGSIENWVKITDADGQDEPNAKAIKFGLGAMLNEGIDVYNEEHEEKRPFFTPKQVGRIITEIGLQSVARSMNQSVIESVKNDDPNI